MRPSTRTSSSDSAAITVSAFSHCEQLHQDYAIRAVRAPDGLRVGSLGRSSGRLRHRRTVGAKRKLGNDAAEAITEPVDDLVPERPVHQHAVEENHRRPALTGIGVRRRDPGGRREALPGVRLSRRQAHGGEAAVPVERETKGVPKYRFDWSAR